MFKYRIWFGSLMLATTSLAFAPVKNEYPMCYDRLYVGEVPDQPFTAQLIKASRQIQPDGRSVPLNTPPALLGLVARDSNGRVWMRSSSTPISNEPESALQEWSETICDPVKGTVATVKYRDSKRLSGPETPISVNAAGDAFVNVLEVHTTAVFAAWHNVVDGRNNMGPETFEGLPAYRYLLVRTHEDGSVREVINSDELFVQLAQTTWKTYPTSEDDIQFTEIHRGEPPPGLFDLPPSIHLHLIPAPKHRQP